MQFKHKTLIPALIALITFVNVSCDDFLEEKPIGKLIPKTPEQLRGMLTASYQAVPGVRSLTSLRSDEIALSPYGQSVSSLKDIFTWNDAAPDPATQPFPYASFYNVIFNVNFILQTLETKTEEIKAAEEQDEVDQLEGEAYALRAYMYFYLVNTYARPYGMEDPVTQKGVPIVPEKLNLDAEYYPNTVAEVYTQITDDLNKAIELLNINEYEKGYNYRFSRVSAFGFAARVYQTMGKWTEALKYANEALNINNSLVDLNNLSDDTPAPFNYQSVENVLAMEQSFDGIIAFDVLVSDKLLQAYDQTNDLRFKTFIKYGSSVALSTGDADKVSMRTAEFYLIKAEALAELDKPAEAGNTLLELLKNRLTPSLYEQTSTDLQNKNAEQMIEIILNERFKELPFQGFRWYDLRRTTRPAITHEYDGETYTLKKDDPRYTVPFPQEAVIANPHLAN
jgi:tetratricopeptide (TPR) repeat protein